MGLKGLKGLMGLNGLKGLWGDKARGDKEPCCANEKILSEPQCS